MIAGKIPAGPFVTLPQVLVARSLTLGSLQERHCPSLFCNNDAIEDYGKKVCNNGRLGKWYPIFSGFTGDSTALHRGFHQSEGGRRRTAGDSYDGMPGGRDTKRKYDANLDIPVTCQDSRCRVSFIMAASAGPPAEQLCGCPTFHGAYTPQLGSYDQREAPVMPCHRCVPAHSAVFIRYWRDLRAARKLLSQ